MPQVYKDVAITLNTAEETDIKQLELKKSKAFLKAVKDKAKRQGWEGKITLVGSEHKSNVSFKDTIETGGRPKVIFFEPKRINCKTAPHLHILLEGANPNTSITKYINEYWTKREGKGNTHFQNAYDKEGYLAYMNKQSSFKRVINL
jgi:hypothetical protein